jgi:hypothetical protein
MTLGGVFRLKETGNIRQFNTEAITVKIFKTNREKGRFYFKLHLMICHHRFTKHMILMFQHPIKRTGSRLS